MPPPFSNPGSAPGLGGLGKLNWYVGSSFSGIREELQFSRIFLENPVGLASMGYIVPVYREFQRMPQA